MGQPKNQFAKVSPNSEYNPKRAAEKNYFIHFFPHSLCTFHSVFIENFPLFLWGYPPEFYLFTQVVNH